MHRRVPGGASRNLAKADRRLLAVLGAAPPGPYMGLDLARWRAAVDRFLTAPDAFYPFVRLEP